MSEEEKIAAEETAEEKENQSESETDGEKTTESTPSAAEDNGDQSGRAQAILEGLLYIVGDDGITSEQAAQALDITPQRADELFQSLKQEYDGDEHGVEVVDYGGTWRFVSKQFISEYGRKLFSLGKKSHLSQAALETLSIIAYKQPITRVEIEEIRGVGADVMLRKLEARNLIKESGRSDAPGRPILYEVTDEFMNSFGLMSLKELPELPKFNDSEDNSEGDLFQQ